MVNTLGRNRVFLNGTGGSRKGQMCKTTQEVGNQKRKGQMQMWTVRTLVRSDRRLGVRVIAYCKGRFGNEKIFHKNGASNLDT